MVSFFIVTVLFIVISMYHKIINMHVIHIIQYHKLLNRHSIILFIEISLYYKKMLLLQKF